MIPKSSLVAIASLLLLWLVSCSNTGSIPTQAWQDPSVTASPSQLVVTPTSSGPLPTEDTPIAFTTCKGHLTGIVITLSNDNWTCAAVAESGGDESLHLTSPLFTIEMSTLGRGSFCEFPGQDESCAEIPFYENKYVSLSTWSSYGEIKEIFGVIHTGINGQTVAIIVSVKYVGMEQRELTQAEKQELINLFDSISFEHLAT